MKLSQDPLISHKSNAKWFTQKPKDKFIQNGSPYSIIACLKFWYLNIIFHIYVGLETNEFTNWMKIVFKLGSKYIKFLKLVLLMPKSALFY